MSQLLFQEFEDVTAKQWKQKIQYDLKGADYNEKLIYKSRDGINVKPFYTAEDALEPAKVPSPKQWDICEKIFVASVEISSRRALEVLKKGAESLWFIIPSEESNIEKLLQDLPLDNISLHLEFQFLSEKYLKDLSAYYKGKKAKMFLHLDIIGNLARSGNWYTDLRNDHEVLEKVLQQNEFTSAISVDASLYQNAGATIPQQLAYALAHANEYLNHYRYKIELKDFYIQFITAAGSNYFFEIAKLRALRILYASLASEYTAKEDCFILSQPTKRDKTLYDFNVNLLRTTTQSMCGILGGANAVYNSPYDAIYHKNNEFGDRIARNQLLVLKNESYLDKVSNAAEGAYYIESLTTQFAEKALEIFKDIEKAGGFLSQLKEGVIQRKITESALKEQEEFDKGELVLIGTNKYENPEDKMKGELELFPFLKKNPRKTLLQPILERRLAEEYEQERLEKEKV